MNRAQFGGNKEATKDRSTVNSAERSLPCTARETDRLGTQLKPSEPHIISRFEAPGA